MATKYYQMTSEAAALVPGANAENKWRFKTRFSHNGVNYSPGHCPVFAIDSNEKVCTADPVVQHALANYKVPNSPFHTGWNAVDHVFEEVSSDPGATDLDQLISEHVNG